MGHVGFPTPYNRIGIIGLPGYWYDLRYDFSATQEVGTGHTEIKHQLVGIFFCADRTWETRHAFRARIQRDSNSTLGTTGNVSFLRFLYAVKSSAWLSRRNCVGREFARPAWLRNSIDADSHQKSLAGGLRDRTIVPPWVG